MPSARSPSARAALSPEGKSRPVSFGLGVLSGAVEPAFGALTAAFAGLIVPAMPYLLSFAAGFGVMMALDVALG